MKCENSDDAIFHFQRIVDQLVNNFNYEILNPPNDEFVYAGNENLFNNLIQSEMENILSEMPEETNRGVMIDKNILRFTLTETIWRQGLIDFEEKYKPK